IQLTFLQYDNEIPSLVDIISTFTSFEYYLRTVRDVKRFLNSFLIKYNIVRGKVDFYTFFMLELFFYKHKNSSIHLYRNRVDFLSRIQQLRIDKHLLSSHSFDEGDILGLGSYSDTDIAMLNSIFFNPYEHNIAIRLSQYLVLSGFDQLTYSDFQIALSSTDTEFQEK